MCLLASSFFQVLQDNNVKKEELCARAKGLKTLGKIFQVPFPSPLLLLSDHLIAFSNTVSVTLANWCRGPNRLMKVKVQQTVIPRN